MSTTEEQPAPTATTSTSTVAPSSNQPLQKDEPDTTASQDSGSSLFGAISGAADTTSDNIVQAIMYSQSQKELHAAQKEEKRRYEIEQKRVARTTESDLSSAATNRAAASYDLGKKMAADRMNKIKTRAIVAGFYKGMGGMSPEDIKAKYAAQAQPAPATQQPPTSQLPTMATLPYAAGRATA